MRAIFRDEIFMRKQARRSRAGSRNVKRRDPSLSGHEEDLLASFEVLVVLVGEQLVDMLLPIVIAGGGVFRVRRAAPLVTAGAGSGYYLVIL